MKPGRILWWLNPFWVMTLLHIPLLAISYLVPDWAYSETWRTPKYLDLESAAVCAMTMLAWLAGFILIGKEGAIEAAPKIFASSREQETLKSLFRVSFVLTIAGYIALWGAALSRGLSLSMLGAALAGEQNIMPQLKDVYFVTIPGLTTLTQFGPAASVFGSLIAVCRGWKSVRGPLLTILALTITRAFFVSERLALIEVVTPAAVLGCRFLRWDASGWFRRTFARTFPVTSVACLLVLFGSFEYFRSWTNFYAAKGGDFLPFVGLRAAGYYMTAFNNSAYLYYNFESPGVLPQFTAEWLWRFPGVNALFGEGAEGVAERSRAYIALLKSGVNPEFNNTGGFLMPVVDFGVIGGVIFWFVAGLISRRLFDGYRSCSNNGLLLFPICFLGILEASRLVYWSSGRVFPTLVMMAVGVVLLNREQRSVVAHGWSIQASR